MLLGGTVTGPYQSPEEWEALLVRSRFRAITAPFTCQTPRAEIARYLEIIRRHGVVIAEVGVWRNVLDPDPAKAAEAMAYAKGQLRLADELGIGCCVNIAGTRGTPGWDAADRSNFAPDAMEVIVASVREIIDDVQPKSAFYTLEPMPWMLPDSPESCLELIRAVDRRQFAAHMDFVNMLNCPRRCLAAEDYIEHCFALLAPHIRSTHVKDIRLDPTRLTTHLAECSPGEGCLDWARVLRILEKHLPADAPLLLEHMQTEAEYQAAYSFVVGEAARIGIEV